MECKETLAKYLSYQKDIDPKKISDFYLALDEGMKGLHDYGYCIDDLDANKIMVANNVPEFNVAYLRPINNPKDKTDNIVNMGQLAVGTYFSIPTEFRDFSHYPHDKFANMYDLMESSVYKRSPNDDYYSNMFKKGTTNCYYSVYNKEMNINTSNSIGKKGASRSKAMVYSTAAGRALTPKDEGAFINIIFYPVMLGVVSILVYVTYILVKIM